MSDPALPSIPSDEHLATDPPSTEALLQNVQDPLSFKYYRPSNTTSAAPSLPDEYYTPTASDLKAAQASLQARTQALTDAPFQLRRIREESERAKRDKWPTTTIRVRFSDRSQLEKTFQSTEKIRSVYAFVRGCLRGDVQPIKFILYQSPPKRDLKVSDPNVRNLTLAELHLAPSSVLLLRFEDDSLNGSDVCAPLTLSILDNAIDLPHPPSLEPLATQPGPTTGPLIASKGNLPKWLKLGSSLF
ncbi:hypothetical protein BDN72DRAFT_772192 [Pluteus cervinus]|uniref:Uncharacterized protein n=1 Tax=Pluteus cervinus TaxID=181527 RepID=A0ACD3ALC3_9AGAR|nr:hypothetical protein BDN72DRAFT_772192 [Pluteus cervinus]